MYVDTSLSLHRFKVNDTYYEINMLIFFFFFNFFGLSLTEVRGIKLQKGPFLQA